MIDPKQNYYEKKNQIGKMDANQIYEKLKIIEERLKQVKEGKHEYYDLKNELHLLLNKHK